MDMRFEGFVAGEIKKQENHPAVEEKRITKEEFDDAVKKAIDQVKHTLDEESGESMGKLLIPLTGAIFAAHMRQILFGKEEK